MPLRSGRAPHRDGYLRRGWRSSAACRQLWAARRWLTGSVHPPPRARTRQTGVGQTASWIQRRVRRPGSVSGLGVWAWRTSFRPVWTALRYPPDAAALRASRLCAWPVPISSRVPLRRRPASVLAPGYAQHCPMRARGVKGTLGWPWDLGDASSPFKAERRPGSQGPEPPRSRYTSPRMSRSAPRRGAEALTARCAPAHARRRHRWDS